VTHNADDEAVECWYCDEPLTRSEAVEKVIRKMHDTFVVLIHPSHIDRSGPNDD
jgi:hypothetical protein